jgi:TIR domain-containing protein
MDGEVFINYRSDDSPGYATLLYVELSRQLGQHCVFMDCESIPAGADFAEQLLQRIRNAHTVLAVIGPSWLTTLGRRRRTRSNEPTDWTQRELVEAFTARVRVIPILTDHATMPTRKQLPSYLAPLSRCQYRRLRCRDATADLTRIINDLTGPAHVRRSVDVASSSPNFQQPARLPPSSLSRI